MIMEKVFIVEIDWNLKGEMGHDILAVTTEDCIKEVFKKLVEEEKNESYLEKFFNTDGTLKEEFKTNGDIEVYEENDKYFNLLTSDFEYYTTMWVTEKNIIKNNPENKGA